MKRFLVLIFLLGLLSYSNAQKTSGDKELPSNDLDGKYSPPSTSLFYTGAAAQRANKVGDVNATLKFNMGILFRGVAASTFEFKLGKASSLNLGLGLAFGRDITQMAGLAPNTTDITLSTSSSDVSLYRLLQSSLFEPQKRLYTSIGWRIYPKYQGNLEGSYFEFGYRVQNYSVKVSKFYDGKSGTSYTVTPFVVNIKNTTFAAIYGYQWQGEHSAFTNNLYFGLGFKKLNYDGVKTTVGQPTNVGTFKTTTLSLNGKVVEDYLPAIIFGWEIGFGL